MTVKHGFLWVALWGRPGASGKEFCRVISPYTAVTGLVTGVSRPPEQLQVSTRIRWIKTGRHAILPGGKRLWQARNPAFPQPAD